MAHAEPVHDTTNDGRDTPKAKTMPFGADKQPEKQEPSDNVPKGVNKEVWAQAEQHVGGRSGTSGVNAEGHRKQVQAEYDQMVANDKATKAWAGDSNLLGGVGGATIKQSDTDTPKTVEDKVRALPQNQGKNEDEMWKLIDAEVAQSRKDGKLRETEAYEPKDKHRN